MVLLLDVWSGMVRCRESTTASCRQFYAHAGQGLIQHPFRTIQYLFGKEAQCVDEVPFVFMSSGPDGITV